MTIFLSYIISFGYWVYIRWFSDLIDTDRADRDNGGYNENNDGIEDNEGY